MDLRAGADFAGHRIEGVAGRGGMGVVFRATDLRLKRTVALKLIASELSHELPTRPDGVIFGLGKVWVLDRQARKIVSIEP